MSGHRIPLHERAHGRWRSILHAVGIDAKYLTGRHGPCPICNAGKDRFRFTDFQGSGAWICNQCGKGAGVDLVMKVFGIDFKEAALKIEAILGDAQVDVQSKKSDIVDLRRRMAELWNRETMKYCWDKTDCMPICGKSTINPSAGK